MARKIYLKGEMSSKFGTVHPFAGETVRDALRCIDANNPGFRSYLLKCHEEDISLSITVQDREIGSLIECLLPYREGDIVISPIPAGSKSGGAKILTAMAITALMFTPMFAATPAMQAAAATAAAEAGVAFVPLGAQGLFALSQAAGGFAGAIGSIITGIGANLAFTGLQQIMAPDPSVDKEEDKGYMLSGSIQNIVEGDPVPVLYGELRVPGRPISFEVSNTNTRMFVESQWRFGQVQSRRVPSGWTGGVTDEASFDMWQMMNDPSFNYMDLTNIGEYQEVYGKSQQLYITDLISEGPIKGLAGLGGSSSVYLNDSSATDEGHSSANLIQTDATFGLTQDSKIVDFDPGTSGYSFTQEFITDDEGEQTPVYRYIDIVDFRVMTVTDPATVTNLTNGITGLSISGPSGLFNPPVTRFGAPGGDSSFVSQVYITQGTEDTVVFRGVIWSLGTPVLGNIYNAKLKRSGDGGMPPNWAQHWDPTADFKVHIDHKIRFFVNDSGELELTSTWTLPDLDDIKANLTGIELTEEQISRGIGVPTKHQGFSFNFLTGEIDQTPEENPEGLGWGVTAIAGNSTDDRPIDGQASGNPYQYEFQGTNSTGFDLSTTQAAEADEIRILFQYTAMFNKRDDSDRDQDGKAFYIIDIAFDRGSGFEPYKTWEGATASHPLRHIGLSKSQLAAELVIPLDYEKPFKDFKVKITRLSDATKAYYNFFKDGVAGEDYTSNTECHIKSLNTILKENLTYPYTAMAKVSVNTRAFTTPPKRTYHCKGLLIKVPSNYVTRDEAANGVANYRRKPDGTIHATAYQDWDGSFRTTPVYTNNPAWIFYDIITNQRYGLGHWLEDTDIDIYALYRIARYCDEIVPDGSGLVPTESNPGLGREPRFTCNVYFQKATDAYKVLKDLATVFRGMLYWLDGNIFPVMDEPKDPVYNFTTGNVIDGVFNYESTGSKTRANQVAVTWVNPDQQYKQEVLLVEDKESMLSTGKIINQSAVAFGAITEGQALRYGRWKLWTAINQTEIASFSTSIGAAFLAPGDIVNIQDASRSPAQIQYSGRISSTITLGTASSSTTDAAGYAIGVTTINLASAGTGTILAGNVVTFAGDTNPYVVITGDDDVSGGGSIVLQTPGLRAAISGATAITLVSNPTYAIIPLDREVALISGSTYELSVLIEKPAVFLTQDDAEIEGVIYTKGDLILKSSGEYTEETALNIVESNSNNTNADDVGKPVTVAWQPYTRVESQTVSTPAGIDIKYLTVWPSFTEAPSVQTIWALKETSGGVTALGSKKAYKILSIAENESKYAITAVEHYNEKFTELDKDFIISLPDPVLTGPTGDCPAPRNVYVHIYVGQNDELKNDVIFQWDAPIDSNGDPYQYVAGYEIEHNVPELQNPFSVPAHRTHSTGLDLTPGTYIVAVRTRNTRGVESPYVSATFTITGTAIEAGVPRHYGIPRGGEISRNVFLSDTTHNFRVTFASYKFASAGSLLHFVTPTTGTNNHVQDCSDIASITYSNPLYSDVDKKLLSHYMFFDASDTSDHLKLIRYTKDATLGIDYWYDTGTGNGAASSNFILTGTGSPAGTVEVEADSIRVVGTSTTFETDYEVGDIIYFTASKGAIVNYIASDTDIRIDRRFPTAIAASSNHSPNQFRFDVDADAIMATVRNNGGTFELTSHLQVDTDLNENPFVATFTALPESLAFDGEDPPVLKSGQDATITLKVEAEGFQNPEFKITGAGFSHTDISQSAETSFTNNGTKLYEKALSAISTHSDTNLAFTATIRETDNPTQVLQTRTKQLIVPFLKDGEEGGAGGTGATGPDGDDGASVNIVFIRAATIPDTPEDSPGIPDDPDQWYDSPPAGNTAGTLLLWASRGKRSIGETNYVWTLPFQVEGGAVAEVYIYRKNNNTPPSGGTYNFVTNTLTTPANWELNPPSISSNGDKVYVSVGLVTGAPTATAAVPVWGAVALFAQRTDGDEGDGVDIIFIRTDDGTPDAPSPSSGTPTGDGWYTDANSVPAMADSLMYSSVGTRLAGATNFIWQTPIQIEGSDGVDGISIAELTIYQRSSTALTSSHTPTSATYNFGTGVLATIGDWSRNIPASDGDPLYASATVASVTGATGTDSSLSWSTPVLSMMDGDEGDPGLRTIQGYLFYEKTSAGTPSAPGGTTYTFSTGKVSGADINDGGTTNTWKNSPNTQSATSTNTYYTIRYTGEEAEAEADTVTVTYSDAVQHTSFSGVVTFIDGTGLFKKDGTNITTIDGGGITTGMIRDSDAFDADEDGTDFTAAGMVIDLESGNIATEQFKIVDGNAAFKGTITGATGIFSSQLASNTGHIGGWKLDDGYISSTNDPYEGSTYSSAGITLNASGSIHAPNFYMDVDGKISATDVDLTGVITATNGYIGGWNIDSQSIHTGTEDHVGYTANAGDMTFYSNGTDASIHAKNFYIDTTGSLTATNVDLTGEITATTGAIGGWTISADKLSTGTAGTNYIALDKANKKLQIGAKASLTDANTGVHLGIDGLALGANSAFKVTPDGAVTAKDLTLTGFGTPGVSTNNTIECDTLRIINDDTIRMGGDIVINVDGHNYDVVAAFVDTGNADAAAVVGIGKKIGVAGRGDDGGGYFEDADGNWAWLGHGKSGEEAGVYTNSLKLHGWDDPIVGNVSGNNSKYLKGDGTWDDPSGVGADKYLSSITQPTSSNSYTATWVMSGTTDRAIVFGSNAFNSTAFTTNIGTITGVTAGTGMSGGGTSGVVTLNNSGVTSIVAGSNVTISPTNGLGAVTINSSGGGGSADGYLSAVSRPSGTDNILFTVTDASNITFTDFGSNAFTSYVDPTTQGYITSYNNYYLDNITREANVLTFAMSGKADETFTFGSNAFTSYADPTSLGYTNNTGTVTGVTGTAPIVSSGGTAPVISLADTAVSDGTYGSATKSAVFTVDAKGRLTAASQVTITGGGGGGSADGYLSAVAKSGTDVVFTVTDASNITFTDFGANAFNSTTIPTNNSQLTNGAGYTTNTGTTTASNTQAFTNKSGSNNQWANDAGYITSYVNTVTQVNNQGGGDYTFNGNAVSNSGKTFTFTDTNTTYSVGDGGLTTKNFTTALYTKLNGGQSVTTSDSVTFVEVTATSDIRLKSNVKTIENALDKVSDMRGVTFDRIEGSSSGVIAQELEKVAPELVKDGEYKAVAYGNLVGYLIEAIKELKDKVEELENGQKLQK